MEVAEETIGRMIDAMKAEGFRVYVAECDPQDRDAMVTALRDSEYAFAFVDSGRAGGHVYGSVYFTFGAGPAVVKNYSPNLVRLMLKVIPAAGAEWPNS